MARSIPNAAIRERRLLSGQVTGVTSVVVFMPMTAPLLDVAPVHRGGTRIKSHRKLVESAKVLRMRTIGI
jgi:hypothetical protein